MAAPGDGGKLASAGDRVGEVAQRAADRGVHVRLLVDDFMLEADGDELLALDAHPNIEIRLYNPTANIGKKLPTKLFNLTTNFRGFNQRMHNKTFIVDSQVVITGGRNIADEYFDYDHAYNFRDRDVLLLGHILVFGIWLGTAIRATSGHRFGNALKRCRWRSLAYSNPARWCGRTASPLSPTLPARMAVQMESAAAAPAPTS